jgi:hypothetical protein
MDPRESPLGLSQTTLAESSEGWAEEAAARWQDIAADATRKHTIRVFIIDVFVVNSPALKCRAMQNE